MYLIEPEAPHPPRLPAPLRPTRHGRQRAALRPESRRHGRGGGADAPTDYKALVCVFLFGGNDYANTVVTYDDPSYNAYSRDPRRRRGPDRRRHRLGQGGTARRRCCSPTLPLTDGRQYALHPAMTALAKLYNTEARWRCSSTSARWWCRSRGLSTSRREEAYPRRQAVLAQRPAVDLAVVFARRLDRRLGRQHRRPDAGAEQQLAVHLHVGIGQRGVPVGRHGLAIPGGHRRRGEDQHAIKRQRLWLVLGQGGDGATGARRPRPHAGERIQRVTQRAITAEGSITSAHRCGLSGWRLPGQQRPGFAARDGRAADPRSLDAGRQAPGVLRLDGRLRPARQPDRQPARPAEPG